MHVEIMVQARMGSTRLPGKVMKEVLGKPLLGYLIERLRQAKEPDGISILTTTEAIDDQIVAYCRTQNITCYRGSEEDVLERYYQAALVSKPDAIVRITSDCPLIDPEILDQVIAEYRKSSGTIDYLSNTLELTYPRGLDVEIFSFKALEEAFLNAKMPYEREHVTVYFYQHPEKFRLKNYASSIPLAQHRWTVDTPEDFHLIQLIIETLYPVNPQFRLKDILVLLLKHPEWSQINAHVQQKKLPS